MVPVRRMEPRSSEALDPFDVGKLRDTEQTRRTEHEGRPNLPRHAIGDDVQHPLRRILVPRHRLHLDAIADLLAETRRLHDVLQVVKQRRLMAEVLRPHVVERERVGVQHRRGVHPCPGIGVLPPRPTRTQLLLQDREVRQTQPLQGIPGIEAGDPRPDHHHREPFRRGQRRSHHLRADPHLLTYQRRVVRIDRLAGGDQHCRVEHLIRRWHHHALTP